MYFIILIFISLLIGLIGWWYYQFLKFSPFLSKYKGPRPIPLLGNVFRISSTKDVVPVIMDYQRKYGPIIKMWFGFRPRLIVSEHRLAEMLLRSTTILSKSHTYKFFHPWLGTGLLTSTGDHWKRQRKLIMPTFNIKILEGFIAIFNNQATVLSEKLQKFVNVGPVDIYNDISLCALDVISESAMGIQLNAQRGNSTLYVDSISNMTELLITRLISPLKGFEFFFRLTEDYRKLKHALNIIHDHNNSIILSREGAFSNLDTKGQSVHEVKRQAALLDLLLKCRKENANVSLESIRDEVNTFMLEGHDSTTTGMSYTLYCLAQNLEVQNKVINELHSIFTNDKYADPSFEDVQEMKYLEMVIKESMRLFPPVPLIARELAKNTEFDGVLYRYGMTVSIFIYALHRREDIFTDPEKFDPERFSTENSFKRSAYAYLPFSAGPRNCIGQRYAMLEMKAILSIILRRIEFLPEPSYKPILATDFVLRPTNGIVLILKDRAF